MIYCKRCGKALSDGAYMCPVCGEPVRPPQNAYTAPAAPVRQPKQKDTRPQNAAAVAGFALAAAGFLIAIVLLSAGFASRAVMTGALSYARVLFAPALAGLGLCIWGMTKGETYRKSGKIFSAAGICLAAAAVLYFLIAWLVAAFPNA